MLKKMGLAAISLTFRRRTACRIFDAKDRMILREVGANDQNGARIGAQCQPWNLTWRPAQRLSPGHPPCCSGMRWALQSMLLVPSTCLASLFIR